jgi:hypothetical protein
MYKMSEYMYKMAGYISDLTKITSQNAGFIYEIIKFRLLIVVFVSKIAK